MCTFSPIFNHEYPMKNSDKGFIVSGRMDSTAKSGSRRPKRGSSRRCHIIHRPEQHENIAVISKEGGKIDRSAPANLETARKMLAKQESPMNPYNKFEYPMIPYQLTLRLEELMAIPGNLKSPACGPPLKTPIEGCSQHPKEASIRLDEAVHSDVIGFDGFACMGESRREFYYAVKTRVESAVKRHKIFLIRGDLPMLVRALETRGWVQKYESVKTRMLPYGIMSVDSKSLGDVIQGDGSLNEKALVFALLRNTPPDFIWDCRNDFVEWDPSVKHNVLLNRFERSSVYTSKLGMARILEQAHWFYEEDVSSLEFPRSYNPARDANAFLEDFRRTAAAGLLKWFVMRIQEGLSIVVEESQTIPISRLEFAAKICQRYLVDIEHENIDQVETPETTDDEWNTFLEDYSSVIHRGFGISNIEEDAPAKLEKCYLLASETLKKLSECDPQYELNGMRNIWILKPSDLCCGTGISISHCIKDIYRRVDSKPKDYFIVQKYIEKPLLIRETKFDIRLWYLVSNTLPLTIWLFKEALLRFSSKPYSVSTYHEAIHLCNTAIQQKYDYEKRRRRKRGNTDETEESIRDQGWDCKMLNEYLKTQGFSGEPYYDTIYPKMSQAIVLTMLAAQEHMDRRRCSFELYGADFMVLDDLSVWLIEINTNPRMHPPSSKITQRLYDSVLESLVKVVMDLPLDPSTDTGGFQLAYKENSLDFIPYLGPGLFVFGKRMVLRENEDKDVNNTRTNICSPWGRHSRAWTAPARSRNKNPKIVDFVNSFER
ncbi:tubulin glycylase 3A-like isoform X2 [Diachasmimorpha longicaudata]|uniref:tubulin glycylase 3A-like isoform X2 n=1 Tax=Diachasmimorpha longicaudata TaxID=58733 RepID=UPI0030B8E61B